MTHYNVVCAVVVIDDRILCMQRPEGMHVSTSLKWEFPGGKIEEGETPEEAICRELQEEMDYEVRPLRRLIKVEYEYPEFSIALDAWLCEADTTEFTMKEHLDSRWVTLANLDYLDWAPADFGIIHYLQQQGPDYLK